MKFIYDTEAPEIDRLQVLIKLLNYEFGSISDAVIELAGWSDNDDSISDNFIPVPEDVFYDIDGDVCQMVIYMENGWYQGRKTLIVDAPGIQAYLNYIDDYIPAFFAELPDTPSIQVNGVVYQREHYTN